MAHLKILVEAFFARIHPLRSLGFLHKPTFMKALDQGQLSVEYGDAVIYVICALGARSVIYKTIQTRVLVPGLSPNSRQGLSSYQQAVNND